MSGIPLDEVVTFSLTTRGTSGVADADSPPTFNVFEEATDTAILVDQTMTKRVGHTGVYRGTFTISTANGFEVGKWYDVIGTGTVGGTTDKTVAMTFRVKAAEAVVGTPKVDVTHFSGSATAADNAEIVFATDFATNYDATNDLWNTRVMRWNDAEVASTEGTGHPKVDIRRIAGDDLKPAALNTLIQDYGDDIFDGGIAGSVWAFNGGRILSAATNITSTGGTISVDGSGRVLLQPTQTGVTIPTVTTVNGLGANTITASALAADAVAEIWGTALAEAYKTAGATGTGAQLLYEILQNLTDFAISGTTKTVKKLDGTTAKTYTLDSATTPTSITETT